MKMEDRSLMPEAVVRSRSAWLRRWPWLLVIAIVAGGAYLAFKPAAGAQRRGGGGRGCARNVPTPVVAARAPGGDVNVYLSALGGVPPLKRVPVRSGVDGELIRVLFPEGEVVRAGDLLGEIAPRQYRAQLEQA